MKVITYNVNGIRAAMNKGFVDWLASENPDVICLQEMKAFPQQVDMTGIEALGYYHYWMPAEKPGYSGVCIMTKQEPQAIVYGCGEPLFDREGRVIRADYEGYSILSIYHPSGSSGEERQAFKMKWLSFFLDYVKRLREDKPNLILCGDYNICHKAIDIHDPVGNKDSSGFLPEEREWFDQFIAEGFIDSFRMVNSNPHQYTWWSYRAGARKNNKGWRIDYVILTEGMSKKLESAKILPEAIHSDHCPMYAVLDLL